LKRTTCIPDLNSEYGGSTLSYCSSRGEDIISCIRPESFRTVLKFCTVREGSVSRSDFEMTGILFSHDKIIMLRIMIAITAECILNFDDGLIITRR
jgi:hypothetical protein